MAGEKLGGNAEVLSDAEKAKVQQELGKAAVEATGSNVINLAENEKWQEYMRQQTDRYGNPAYAEETIANVGAEGTETMPPAVVEGVGSPAVVETQEFMAPAVVAEQTTEVMEVPDAEEVQKILAGRTVEQAMADLTNDRNAWQAEIDEIRAEGGPYNQLSEAQQKQIANDQARIAEVEQKLAILEKVPMAAGAEAEVAEEAEDLVEQAASGELDLNNPNDVTEQQMRRARFEQVIADVEDLELKEKLEEELEKLERADAERAANEFNIDAEVVDGVAREIGAQAEAAEVELTPEAREKLEQEVTEKVKGRTGFKKLLGRIAVTAATVVITASALFASIASNFKSPQNALAATEQGIERDLSVDDLNQTTFGDGTELIAGQKEAEFDVDGFIDEMMKSGETDLSQHDIEAIGGGLLETMDKDGQTANKYGVLQNRKEHYDGKNKESINAFGEDLSYLYDMKEGREAETIKRLLAIERDQPETLAAHAADLPNVLRAAGVDESIINIENFDERQKAVDALFDQEGGAELQKKLLGAMAVVLGSADYTFYLENGTERTSYIYHLNGNESTTDNLVLGTDVKDRDNAKQVQAVMTYADGTQEVVDLNLACGVQPNHTPEGKKRTPVSVDLEEDIVPAPIITELTEELITPGPGVTPPGGTEPPATTPPGGTEPPATTPPGGTPKPKDEENEKKVVDDGGQTNPVDKTDNLDDKDQNKIEKPSNETDDNKVSGDEITGNMTGTYGKTEEESATAKEDAQEKVEAGMQQDNKATEEEKKNNHENQVAANEALEKEDLTDMTDEEYANYIEQILGKR